MGKQQGERDELMQKPQKNMAAAIFNAGAASVKQQAFHDNLIVLAFVLHDKLDFDSDKLFKTLGQVSELWDSVIKGYVNVRELEATLREETGIAIKGTVM